MKPHRNKSSFSSTLDLGHNILGATGLSRACLRSMFAVSGLFGAHSALSGPEQSALYAELQLPAGAVPPVQTTIDVPNHRRLAAIRSVVRALLSQHVDGYERQLALARRSGVQEDVLSEVTRTARTAMLVYGVSAAAKPDVGLAVFAPVEGANEVLTVRACA